MKKAVDVFSLARLEKVNEVKKSKFSLFAFNDSFVLYKNRGSNRMNIQNPGYYPYALTTVMQLIVLYCIVY